MDGVRVEQTFRSAPKSFTFVIPSELQLARGLLFGFFCGP